MKFIITEEIINAVLSVNAKITFDTKGTGAVLEVQTAVDWFLQMAKAEKIRKSSPSAYEVKHRIERQPTGYQGYISQEAAMIGVRSIVICIRAPWLMSFRFWNKHSLNHFRCHLLIPQLVVSNDPASWNPQNCRETVFIREHLVFVIRTKHVFNREMRVGYNDHSIIIPKAVTHD